MEEMRENVDKRELKERENKSAIQGARKERKGREKKGKMWFTGG